MNNEKALRQTTKLIPPGLLTVLTLALVLTLGIILYPMRVQAAPGAGATFTDVNGLSYEILTPADGSNNGTVKLIGESGYSDPNGLQIPEFTSDPNDQAYSYIVVGIEDYAFVNNPGLTGELKIPDSVESIGNFAFLNCFNLTGNLTIPNSVETIGNYAFSGCYGFNGELTISNSAKSIGYNAFSGCVSLTGNLTIPNSVESIGYDAFHGCLGFDGTLTLSSNLESIEAATFLDCSGLTGNLSIPDSVTSIGGNAFSGCSSFSGDLTIPDSVESIGDTAFYGCSGLNGSLTIPDSVTSIGGSVFYGCPFTEMDTYVDSSVMADAFLNPGVIGSGAPTGAPTVAPTGAPSYDISGIYLTCPEGSVAGYIALGFAKERITERLDVEAPGTDDNGTGDETDDSNSKSDPNSKSKGKNELSPYAAFGKEWAERILNAEKGESLKLCTDVWVSFPGYVIDALATRRDLTLELIYKYEGVWYQTIIPAGAEVPTGVPYAGFYGYLGGMYGRTVVE